MDSVCNSAKDGIPNTSLSQLGLILPPIHKNRTKLLSKKYAPFFSSLSREQRIGDSSALLSKFKLC